MSPLRPSTLKQCSLHQSACGPLAVDEVWQRYTQPRWWTVWAPHLLAVEYPEPVVVAGTKGRVVGPGGITADFHIDAVDHAARTWRWSVRSGPLEVTFEHGVDPAPVGSPHLSRAWLTTRAVRPVAWAYAPIAQWALHRLVRPHATGGVRAGLT